MELYRYRTAALLGPWRVSPEEAIADALYAGQAFREADGRLAWRVSGSIDHVTGEAQGGVGR